MSNEENKNTEEIKRHIDVMLENVRSDFKLFGEGLSDVSRKVDELTEKTDFLIEDMDQVKSNIVEIKSDIVEIKSDIVEINAKLDKKADKDTVENYEIRIVKLEKATSVA
ncbi:MAG TPA: hypothetical protein DCS28_04330 [Candidatus Moranbacteria bacterium]|nr:hypothetical protein [Candidatus Moranbacteria bacterium]HAT75237.1 hypothetical protein [Candidatus Moranbacteria bacterium]